MQAWLAKNPRITLHFTPTSGSWLNMVEIFFGIITRQAIRRGTFTSVKDLIAAIETFIDGWNERCHPFVWTKTADEILKQGHPRSKIIVHATLVAVNLRCYRMLSRILGPPENRHVVVHKALVTNSSSCGRFLCLRVDLSDSGQAPFRICYTGELESKWSRILQCLIHYK